MKYKDVTFVQNVLGIVSFSSYYEVIKFLVANFYFRAQKSVIFFTNNYSRVAGGEK